MKQTLLQRRKIWRENVLNGQNGQRAKRQRLNEKLSSWMSNVRRWRRDAASCARPRSGLLKTRRLKRLKMMMRATCVGKDANRKDESGSKLWKWNHCVLSSELQRTKRKHSENSLPNLQLRIALFTLVPSLVTGGVVTPVIQGLGLASQSGLFWSTAFFMSYYYFGVLILFNIFVSFIIDGLSGYEPEELDQVPDEIASFLEELRKHPEEGFEVTYITRTSQDTVYQKMFKEELDELIQKDMAESGWEFGAPATAPAAAPSEAETSVTAAAG